MGALPLPRFGERSYCRPGEPMPRQAMLNEAFDEDTGAVRMSYAFAVGRVCAMWTMGLCTFTRWGPPWS
jgi:hypothetical protein